MKQPKFNKILTKEFLYQANHIDRKSATVIAKEVGCDAKTITNYMSMYHMEYMWCIPKNKKNKNHGRWKGYEDISRTYWNNVINGAKTRKIEFSITIEYAWNLYIIQNKKCKLSSMDIEFNACKNNTASLDRIDPTKGYINGNIQWLHKEVNFAKQSMTNEEFINLCQKVAQTHQQSN